MTSCREKLGNTCCVEAGFRKTEGGTQTGTTSTDDYGIVFVILQRSESLVQGHEEDKT